MCFDVGSESDSEGLDSALHALAVPADDGHVEHGGWFGDIGDVLADVELGQVRLAWQDR